MLRLLFILLLNLCCVFPTQAARYILDGSGATLVGEASVTEARERDTLLDIARFYGFGYQDMKLVNPELDTWLPGAGQKVILPSQFVLPFARQEGIVLNIPEMRLYYYPPLKKGQPREVLTYPLGIGREGWATPYISTRIIEKKVKPNWYPPESIRREYEEAGDPLPKIVRPGPDNPLGDHAMRLGRPEYLIHGTNKPYGIGMRVSHGCIRLYPEDIEALFSLVTLRTPVNIINQPYKIGVKNDVIYLEAHPFLQEDSEKYRNNLTSVVSLLINMAGERGYEVDWDKAHEVINQPTGLPVAIGMFLPEIMPATAGQGPQMSISGGQTASPE